MPAKRVVVHGEVQGVFFRDSCRQEALTAGVAGWVRNDPAGTVEALFEGPGDAVARMIKWCESGPSQASVDRVEVVDQAESGLGGFEVRS